MDASPVVPAAPIDRVTELRQALTTYGLSVDTIIDALIFVDTLFQRHNLGHRFPVPDSVVVAESLAEYLQLYEHTVGTLRIDVYVAIIEGLRNLNPEIWSFLPKMEEITVDPEGKSLISVSRSTRRHPIYEAECHSLTCRTQFEWTDLYDARCGLIRLFILAVKPEILEPQRPSEEFMAIIRELEN